MKFDFGDEVEKVGTSQTNQPGAVVEFTLVKYPDQVLRYGQPLGTILCTVEFGDGKEEMIPEADLRLVSPTNG